MRIIFTLCTRLCVFLFISLLCLFALTYFAINTHLGSKIIIQFCNKYLLTELTFSKFEGVLGQQFTFENMHYLNDQISIRADKLNVTWVISDLLFHQKLHINELLANDININLKSSDKFASKKPQSNSAGEANIRMFSPWIYSTVLNHLSINNLTVRSNSQPIYHIKNFNVTGDGRKASIAFNGSSDINNLLDIAHARKNAVTINCLAQIKFTNNGIYIESAKLNTDNSSLSAQGRIDDQFDLDWRVAISNLSEFYHPISGKILSEGKLQGTIKDPIINANVNAENIVFEQYSLRKLQGEVKTFADVEANVNIKGIRQSKHLINILLHDLNINDISIKHLHLKADSYQQNHSLIIKTRALIDDNNYLDGSFTLPHFSGFMNTNQNINGDCVVKIPQLNHFIAKLPETKIINGEVSANLHLSGKINQPQYHLTLKMVNGIADLPRYGLKLRDIQLDAKTSDDTFSCQGMLTSGNGHANLSGSVSFKDALPRINLHAKGTNLTLLHTNEYDMTGSPNLEFNYANNQMTLAGFVEIPHAKIEPKDYSSAATLPKEAVIIKDTQHDNKEIRTNIYDLTLNLKVNLGNDIKIKYKDLSTKLGGTLTIFQNSGSPITAIGELHTIDGLYKTYGNSLKITKGELSYTGNIITNPGLNIRAIKKVKNTESVNSGPSNKVANAKPDNHFSHDHNLDELNDTKKIIVGVKVTGTLEKPIVTLFSEPNKLNNNDILSYLVFGYPQANINDKSSITLLNLLLANSGKSNSGVKSITKNLKSFLGLKHFKFKFGNTEYYDPEKNATNSGSSLTIRKKLGKRFSISYTTGIFTPISILELKYRITKRLAVKSAASTTDTGADLIYEVDRN